MADKRKPATRYDDSWIAVLLRLFVAGIAGLAATWQAATDAGMIATACGAMVGVIIGEVLGRTRARLTLAVLLGVGFALLGSLSWSLCTRWESVATSFGTGRIITIADAALLANFAIAICLLLRSVGSRYRVVAAFELGVLAMALAAPLAAHRGGAINRPLPLADYAWSQGEDPLIYLQLAGGAAAIGLALFLVAERRWIRAIAAAVMVLVASIGMGYLASMIQPPAVGPGSGLGLTGRGNEEGQRGQKGPRSLDQLDFQDHYGTKRRNAPVAVVLLHDDYSPSVGAYYFRQNAFSRYNGRRMVSALDQSVDRDVFPFFPASKRRAEWVPETQFRVPIETSMALIQDHVNPVVLEAAESVSPAKNPSPRRFRRTYKATSLALNVRLIELVGMPVGDPVWSPQIRQLYLEAPTDPRYRQLVDSIIERLPEQAREDRVARALMIAEDLSRRGIYSLRSRHAKAVDPTASFLFGDMTGYCVHFAHAAVYLFRTAGVPARLATGYQYPEKLRGRGSSLLIRGGDAHAWPEIYVDRVGWVVVDITPAQNLEEQGAPLDPELQRMLGEMLRGQLEDQRTAALEMGDAPVALADIFEVFQVAARVLLGVMVFTVLFLYLGKIYRRAIVLVAAPTHRTRLTYRLALDRLSEVGCRRERGEPPERFAARLEQLAPSLAELVRAASARALGSQAADDPEASLELGRAVKRELKRGTKWWRRIIGVLDPLTWIRVR